MSNFTPAQRDWIDALRSGEYMQCRSRMSCDTNRGFAYCCLGVACERYIKNGGRDVVAIHDSDYSGGYRSASGIGYFGSRVPDEVMTYMKLKDVGAGRLAMFNDGYRWTFEQIANELEAHPEKYFIQA